MTPLILRLMANTNHLLLFWTGTPNDPESPSGRITLESTQVDLQFAEGTGAFRIRNLGVDVEGVRINEDYYLPNGVLDPYTEVTRYQLLVDKQNNVSFWLPSILAIGYRANPLAAQSRNRGTS